MKLAVTNFSIRHPWLILVLVLVVMLVAGAQFPRVQFDNDPENMLAEDEPVRLFHHAVKTKFNLYDFVIVGIVNEQHPDGAFNTGTLGRIFTLTDQLLRLRQGADGVPEVPASPESGPDGFIPVDLSPDSAWHRALAIAFRHDPNNLFDDDGRSAIITREIISPSVVDNLRQAEFGSLKLEYLMETAPRTAAEARRIRDDAMDNPLYKGTLVSEDEKAIALYIPLTEKSYSYNVAALVRALTADWGDEDAVYITGLPVAEDTFGVEMLVQMATSAPLAGAAIFVLLLLFFRKLSLVIAPMLLAVVCVVTTMGLLIGLGFDVHIMSSMIAIFLMPIAVADSVHILSEFFDVYPRFKDRAATLRHVIGHLFMPMLYTSLTTMVGFGSLAITPIPPVQVFGLHVAFGVGLAWVLTMSFIPATIMLLVPQRTLDRHAATAGRQSRQAATGLNRALDWLGGFGYARAKLILAVTGLVVIVAVVGIMRIRVNDNPVKWFVPSHDIRIADAVLNRHFGGTYTAYLTLDTPRPDLHDCREKGAIMRREAEARFGAVMPAATARFLEALQAMEQRFQNVTSSDMKQCFVELVNRAAEIDAAAHAAWQALADDLQYLDPEGLEPSHIRTAVQGIDEVDEATRREFLAALDDLPALEGEALLDAALNITDGFTALSFREFVFGMEAELTAPMFKRPALLRYVEQLQAHLMAHPKVGKTTSAVDALKKGAYELNYVAPPADADADEEAAFAGRNRRHRAVPDTAAAVGQVFTQLEGMKKQDSLFHLVTKDYREANLWIQLTSGDNADMQSVVEHVEAFLATHPPPEALEADWAGLTYINVIWQEKMVSGMISSLLSSFVIVFIMMAVLFRSPLYGVLAMLPLSVTIAFIYGLIGLVGKDYDMPVAILSALTLGLSVDFAIHFLERARETVKAEGSWDRACRVMFKEPAMAISRNAITISVGFTPLLLAPLVPYRTVGFFLATIMAVSWAATLFLLPALLTVLQRLAFRREADVKIER